MAGPDRIPVATWPTHSGLVAACSLEEPTGNLALAPTVETALRQLKEGLEWRYRETLWLPTGDVLEPALFTTKISVRPEYEARGRLYPCSEAIHFRAACVRGRQPSGLLVCVVPALGLRFECFDEASLPRLAHQYVNQALKGLTPQALRDRLPTATLTLHEVVLKPNAFNFVDWLGGGKRRQVLAQVTESLTDRRRRGTPAASAWGRPSETEALVQRLRQERVNVILVGEAGVGKSTVLLEAARRLSRLTTPEPESETEERVGGFYWTNASRLIAGMAYLGQWEERCERLIEALSDSGAILCVDNLLDLVTTGGQGPHDSLAAFFLPYLQRGELRLVTEATPAELQACQRLLPGFVEVFQILPVPTLDATQALAALSQIIATQEQRHAVAADPNLDRLVYRLFHRFQPYHPFPGPSATFLAHVFRRAAEQKIPRLAEDLVLREFTRHTGLPEIFLRDELPLAHDTVGQWLAARVLGQETACAALAHVITTFKAGMNDPQRPLGVLLFCGPTGVGKTALAKAAAEFCFGQGDAPDRLVRVDLSEYAAPGSAERLLQDARGGPSDLIKRLRQQPFVVVLLDEIEKAAPEVFDVLLSVFDEGRLTDPRGRLTNLRSALIILTSNLGATPRGALGFGAPEPPAADAALTAFFRPEFFNRLDAVVPFTPLSETTVLAITRKELGELAAREGLRQAALRLHWSAALELHLARVGFDRRLGARPLQRAIERWVVTPLARYLVAHPHRRGQTLRLDWRAETLVIDAD